MITEGILNLFVLIPNALLNNMEGVSISIPDNVFSGLDSIFNCLGFLFPISGLLIILTLSFAIKSFQIIWSIVLRVKSFIPTMGA